MEPLNLRELIIVVAGITILTGFMMGYLKYTAPHIQGSLHWAIGTFLVATGLMAYGFYPRPSEYVNLLITNISAFTGQCLFLVAIWKFKEKPVNYLYLFSIVVLAFVSTTVFTLIYPHMGLRVSVNSILYTFPAGYCLYEMLKPPDRSLKLIFQINALAILIYIVAMLTRTFGSFPYKEIDLMAPTAESIILFSAVSLSELVLTFGFTIMVNIRLAQALIRQNAVKDKFFSIIAHDLKNPMNNIMGFSDLLALKLGDKNSEETAFISKAIKQSVIQTNNLLDNLLEWALSQTGKVRCIPGRINLLDFFSDEVAYYKPFSESKQISLHTDGVEDIHTLADRNMLKTIMRNLITNAIKYSQPGASINIATKRLENHVEISVTDTGIGILEDQLKRLFVFEDLHTTRGTQDEKGSGLGLMLCKEFIEKNGGRLCVKSKPGEGSTFSFTLPLVMD